MKTYPDTYNFHLYIGSDAEVIHPFDVDNYEGCRAISCKKMNIHVSECHNAAMVQLMHSNRPAPVNEGGLEADNGFPAFKLKLRSIDSMTEKEKNYMIEHFTDLRPNFPHESHFLERLDWDMKNEAKKISWLIKRGFDVGIIPQGRFVIKK